MFGSEVVNDPNIDEGLGMEDEYTCSMVNAEIDQGIREDPLLADILQTIQSDVKYKEASQALMKGLSKDDVKRLPSEHGAKQYLSVWDHLGVLDDREDTVLLFEGHRIVVPNGCQKEILRRLHIPHSGIVKTKRAASERYYFAGMGGRIEQMVQGCRTCQEFGASKPAEPPIETKPEGSPMVRVGVDLFEFGGNKYLVMIDYYSHFPLIKKFGKASSTNKVIKALSKWFDLYGFPKYCRHDSGGEFRSRFKEYLREMGVISEPSSAYNPASNGRVERSVGQVKQILKRSKAARECFYTALAEWRLAPRAECDSPSKLFYNRHVRSGRLPEVPAVFDVGEAKAKKEAVQRRNMDRKTTRHPRKMLAMDQDVLLQDQQTRLWSIKGRIVQVRPSGKSYIVRTDNGRYLRSIKFIKPDPAADRHAAYIVVSAESTEKLTSALKKEKGGPSSFSSGSVEKKVRFQLPGVQRP